MTKTSLTAVAHGQLATARNCPQNRSAHTVHGGHEHSLRQTVIALLANEHLHEQEHRGETTVYVLQGRVRLVAGRDSWEAVPGDLLSLPDGRHRVEAVSDAVFLFTNVVSVGVQSNG
ncbi:LuxR family transcriptional regulator [Kutzneria sp. NPDC051319]|uniref:LuxR family transcriptional regulator n=1 Tax=Kutzneria sp. NPDC051319 TaxID=3155047 RepID=UPI0034392C8A